MREDPLDRMYRRYNEREGGRTGLSRRREMAQRDQRVMWGDLRPGQRSLNDGS